MGITTEEIETVRKATILRDLKSSEFESVIQFSQTTSIQDGAFFFLEGNPADKGFILIEGKVKLEQVTSDGRQILLGYLVPGRVFGIIAILKKVTYPVSAQAVGTSKAIYWEQDTLNQLMKSYPIIALNALHIMAGQIRQFQNQVKDLSTKRVEQRIARAILRLARQSGKRTDEGVLIDLLLSRQDLAEMTGTTLYTVSRILTDWEKGGLVKSYRQKIIITYPHGLVTIAEDLPTQQTQESFVDIEDLCDL